MSDEYNGWTNRETWATALHIDNDEGLHDQRNELCNAAIKEAAKLNIASPEGSKILADPQRARRILAESLESWIGEMAEDVYFPGWSTPPPSKALLGMFHDIGSLWRINWDEIAKNFLDELELEATA